MPQSQRGGTSILPFWLIENFLSSGCLDLLGGVKVAHIATQYTTDCISLWPFLEYSRCSLYVHAYSSYPGIDPRFNFACWWFLAGRGGDINAFHMVCCVRTAPSFCSKTFQNYTGNCKIVRMLMFGMSVKMHQLMSSNKPLFGSVFLAILYFDKQGRSLLK